MNIKGFMERIIWDKVKWVLIIPVLVVLTIFFLVNRSCTGDSEAQYWKGQYDILKAVTDIERDISLEDIECEKEAKLAAQKEIELLLVARVRDEQRYKLLEAQRQKLIIEEPVQPELETEPLVINLREQIKKMSLIVYEQEKIIQGNDKIIFNLTIKYQAQLKISDDYKLLYDGEKELHALAIKRLKISDKRITGLKFGGIVKTGTIAVVVGLLIFSVLK